MPEISYCAKHPKTETNLQCGRCEEPICPRCMVQTLVGARCQGCARVRRLPTYDVTAPFLARAIVVGLVLGVGGGVGVVILGALSRIYLLELIVLVGVGYLIGEGISMAVNQKRGPGLKVIAAVSMLIAFSIVSLYSGATLSTYGLVAGAVAFYVAMKRF